MVHIASVFVTGLASSAAAARTCQNFTVPVTASARNGVFNVKKVSQPLDATAFTLNITRQGSANFSANYLTGYATVQGTYNISVQWCTNGTKGNAVQVLTHGIGFDKTYWDIPFNAYNYSYTSVALSQGYDTFAYDRLGIGNSSHGDPLNEIQAPLEVAALAKLTQALRNGTISQIGSAYQKIIHVGHSFGSAQTYALVNAYPNISDGIVLTGFSTNSSFMNLFAAGNNLQIAAYNQPFRLGNNSASLINQALSAASSVGYNVSLMSTAAQSVIRPYALTDYIATPMPEGSPPLNYPLGYMVNRDVDALQYNFLYPGYFNASLAYYGEQGKQPVTQGELLTVANAAPMNAFTGPVLTFTGDYDLPFCGGNCSATGGVGASIPAAVQKSFPSAKTFTVYIQPNTGHGLNFHYNATAGYQAVQTWLKSQGL